MMRNDEDIENVDEDGEDRQEKGQPAKLGQNRRTLHEGDDYGSSPASHFLE